MDIKPDATFPCHCLLSGFVLPECFFGDAIHILGVIHALSPLP